MRHTPPSLRDTPSNLEGELRESLRLEGESRLYKEI